MFNLQQCIEDKCFAKALMRGLLPNGEIGFRWFKVTVVGLPDPFGNFQVKRIRNGEYGTTNRLRNLTPEERQELLGN